MRPRTSLILLLTSIASITSAHDTTDDLVFAAIGDGPYATQEWQVFQDQIALINKTKQIRFLAHVGDIWHGSPTLPGRHYTRVADMLKTSKKPVFIIPGDNEWNDLDDPAIGWGHWLREFTNFEQNFKDIPKTTHQEARSENFSFQTQGVLFIGINLVGGRVHDQDEWNQRFKHNAAWIKEHFAEHKGTVRAAVVLSHAQPAGKHDPFFEDFTKLVRKFQKPVLYLHGDGHNFDVKYPWKEPNLWRVQIDSLGKNPPLQVRVTNDLGEPFRFNRYYK